MWNWIIIKTENGDDRVENLGNDASSKFDVCRSHYKNGAHEHFVTVNRLYYDSNMEATITEQDVWPGMISAYLENGAT